MKTLAELLQYVVSNRNQKAFRGYTEEQICNALLDAAASETLLYHTTDNELDGVVVGRLAHNNMHVVQILTTNHEAFKMFAKTLTERWPKCTLSAHRKGVLRAYAAEKLTHKILKGIK